MQILLIEQNLSLFVIKNRNIDSVASIENYGFVPNSIRKLCKRENKGKKK